MHCRGGRHSLSMRSTASLDGDDDDGDDDDMNELDLFSMNI